MCEWFANINLMKGMLNQKTCSITFELAKAKFINGIGTLLKSLKHYWHSTANISFFYKEKYVL